MEQLTYWDNHGNFLSRAVKAVIKGDLWIRLGALLVLIGAVGLAALGSIHVALGWVFGLLTGVGVGLCYWGRGQYIKGTLFCLLQTVAFALIFMLGYEHLAKLGSLGTVQYEVVIDWATGQQTVNDYDHSFKILLYSVIAMMAFFIDALLVVNSWGTSYRLLLCKRCGKKINNFVEDLRALMDEKFHLPLLTLPGIGVLIFVVVPMVVLIFVGFTNYDSKHLPPSNLFTWVGFDNFYKLLLNFSGSAFSYAFRKILGWTIVWALAATFTTYFGGILLSILLNNKHVVLRKMWRTLFVICIAVPQFITLMLISRFFGNQGIANTFLGNAHNFLKSIGLVSGDFNNIPFLTDPVIAKIMIILINIWIGIPYQMLIATGILMNIPTDIMESAKIDGASGWVRFWKITMPYYWSVTGPSVITSIVANINNFNVIYLLTEGTYVTLDMQMATVQATEVDLLITWLFSLTQGDAANYAMASVIGIVAFVICAAFTLFSLFYMQRGGREKAFG